MDRISDISSTAAVSLFLSPGKDLMKNHCADLKPAAKHKFESGPIEGRCCLSRLFHLPQVKDRRSINFGATVH